MLSGKNVWRELTHLKIGECCLGEMGGLNLRGDDGGYPVSKFIKLESLNYSRNQILNLKTGLAGLSSLMFLSKVDLSYNFLKEMKGSNLMLGNVKVLILTGNRLKGGEGLERLYSLERLELGGNLIEDLQVPRREKRSDELWTRIICARTLF